MGNCAYNFDTLPIKTTGAPGERITGPSEWPPSLLLAFANKKGGTHHKGGAVIMEQEERRSQRIPRFSLRISQGNPGIR